MRFIEIEENLNCIISLVENAGEFIILVSPFNDFEGWDKLKNAINSASKRGVEVSYYVREEEGVPGTEDLDVTIYEVPNLHSKMFYSENEAVIGSAHLKYNEDINWTYILDKQKEYDEMKGFFDRNIKPLAFVFRK